MKKLAMILILTSLASAAFAAGSAGDAGNSGSTGGGAPEEGEFIQAGKDLAKDVEFINAEYKLLAPKFKAATESTQVKCADTTALAYLRDLHQMAWYEDSMKTISLDCTRWPNEKDSLGAKINLVHEYLRAATNDEDKKYTRSTFIVDAIKTLGKAKPEYGAFRGYAELVDLYKKRATQVDEYNTLNIAATFSCAEVTPDNQTKSVTYAFYKQAGQGIYEHRLDLALCKTVACIAFDVQPFIVNSFGELASNGELTHGSFVTGKTTRDDGQIKFRQIDNGHLVGVVVNSHFGWDLSWHKQIDSVLYCSRESLRTH